MTATRPRLIVIAGDGRLTEAGRIALNSAFELFEASDFDTARSLVRQNPDALVIRPGKTMRRVRGGGPPVDAANLLRYLGEAVGVVNRAGSVTWMNQRLQAHPKSVRDRFIQLCREFIENTCANAPVSNDESPRPSSRKMSFESGDAHFDLEVMAATGGANASSGGEIESVIGLLWDVTAGRTLQKKLDAIDAAGSELLRIEAESIAQLNMAERLRLLETKIISYVHDLLDFDNFEIRLLNRETNQLELVFAVGLSPLRIGEVIYAETEGNGISGYVAATGKSYVCPEVKKDPRYREGLDNAASSLTVPLRLHDRVIGVFNAESYTPDVFDENDRRFAEIFGRYIAMAMNIVDLLVVERYTTNEQIAANVLGELNQPLGEITAQSQALQAGPVSAAQLEEGLARILDAATTISTRLEDCMRGPRTVLGAEQELADQEIDPGLLDKQIMIVDDDPAIRETVAAILSGKGCQVSVHANGADAIAELKSTSTNGTRFDLVLSDIKLPDRNGYEVFRASKAVSTDTPVILMTGFGYDPNHSIVRATQEGLHSFLFKPFKASQLLDELKKALGEKSLET